MEGKQRYLLLFPVDHNIYEFFCRLHSNVFDAMSLFQTHESRGTLKCTSPCVDNFPVWPHDFFVLHDVHSQHVYLQEESLLHFLSTVELSAWPLLIS